MAEQHSLTEDYETPYKFNGKELDTETGLYYYGARYYDPRTSIWLSVDPLVEQTQTPYQYCTNNPINFIDPSGMSEKEWDYDIETHEMKMVGNKGGDTTDYINYKSGGETFYTKTKDVQHSTMTIGAMFRSESGKASVIRGPGFLSTWISEYKPADDSIESMEFSSPFFLWGAVLGNALKGVSGIFGGNTAGAVENGIANSRALGIAGEEAVGITGSKTAISVAGRTRIPDRLTSTVLEKVKNVRYQSFTRQLRDFSTYAQDNGLEMILHTRSSTILSKPLHAAIKDGIITHRVFP